MTFIEADVSKPGVQEFFEQWWQGQRAAQHATEKLDVTLSGVGGVAYYGGPEVTQRVTGLGGVTSPGKP